MNPGAPPGLRDPVVRGRRHGRSCRAAVRTNVAGFRLAAAAAGWEIDLMLPAVHARAANLPVEEKAELAAIADGAGVDRDALLLFALGAHILAPDECTVAAAVGSASATGSTVLLKNSDKIGADTMVGPGYHLFKEVNVVVDVVGPDGTRILGVAAAGSTGLKMGVNDAGVAAASNIVRTTELRDRKVDLEDLLAPDRGRLLREGLALRSAREAAERTMEALAERPMATPGNLHFAGPADMFIVEGSYHSLAAEWVRDAIAVRSNAFVLLDALNDPGDRSSPAREARALEMLTPHTGAITADHLLAVSVDHRHGPGPNSICRHSGDHREETSLSAMIVALEPRSPATVEFALGKPCRAWNTPEGHLRMTTAGGPVPERFADGTAWREMYGEEADESLPRRRHPSG